MKFKKITYFKGKTLDKFIIQINFVNDFTFLNIIEISNFAKTIEKYFPISPRLALMPRPGESIELGPIIFKDNEEGSNIFQIGRNFLSFIFTKYEKWEKELDKILIILNNLNKFMKFSFIKDIIMTYIDNFKLPKDGFELTKYFTISIDPEKRWDIKYHDLFLGIVPYEKTKDEQKSKIVLRLRTSGIDESNYLFSLESIYFMRNINVGFQESIFKSFLNEAHEYIETYFINFLTEKYQKDLELEFIELEMTD